MEIVFLGCGGGRVVVDRQLLATGGFRINSAGIKMHADPGPGALIHSLHYKQDPVKLDAIFASHAHLDHSSDLNLMVEAMNFGSFNKKRGALVAGKAVLSGGKGHEKVLGEYFRGMLQECKPLKGGETHAFGKRGARITATKTDHEDETGIGFVLEADGMRIGYTGDTQAFDGIGRQFEACDVLVANVLRPDDDKLEFHLTTNDLIQIVSGMKKKPRQVIFSHAGAKMMKAGREQQRKKFEEKTGVKAILAQLGLKVSLDELLPGKQQRLS